MRNLTEQFRPCLILLIAFVMAAGSGCSREVKKEQLLTRANESFQAGDYETAEVEYLNALRFEHTNQLAMRNLGLIAADQGRLGHAFSLLTQAKKNNPNDFQVRLKLAQCLLAGGGSASGADYQWAFSLLQETARKLPADAEVLFDYARATYAIGQVNEAVGIMERAVKAKISSTRAQQAEISCG